MHKTPLHRAAMLVLLLAVTIGWSAQAFSFARTGTCVGAMAGMGMSSPAPMESSSDNGDDAGAMPCKGVAVRCMNSVGCVVSVAIPQATFVVEAPERFGDPEIGFIGDLVGLSLEPELSPPIQAA